MVVKLRFISISPSHSPTALHKGARERPALANASVSHRALIHLDSQERERQEGEGHQGACPPNDTQTG
eukprot:2439137-Amphidinium_carterae.1